MHGFTRNLKKHHNTALHISHYMKDIEKFETCYLHLLRLNEEEKTRFLDELARKEPVFFQE